MTTTDYKKRYNDLRNRKRKETEELRSQLQMAWDKNKQLEHKIRSLETGDNGVMYEIHGDAQWMGHGLCTAAEVTAKKWLAVGMTDLKLAKKGDKFMVEKIGGFSFRCKTHDEFTKKCTALIDAGLWFLTTRQVKRGDMRG